MYRASLAFAGGLSLTATLWLVQPSVWCSLAKTRQHNLRYRDFDLIFCSPPAYFLSPAWSLLFVPQPQYKSPAPRDCSLVQLFAVSRFVFSRSPVTRSLSLIRFIHIRLLGIVLATKKPSRLLSEPAQSELHRSFRFPNSVSLALTGLHDDLVSLCSIADYLCITQHGVIKDAAVQCYAQNCPPTVKQCYRATTKPARTHVRATITCWKFRMEAERSAGEEMAAVAAASDKD